MNDLATATRGEREKHYLARYTRLERICELLIAYRATAGAKAGAWHVRNLENGELAERVYPDEGAARAAARMLAALEIESLFFGGATDRAGLQAEATDLLKRCAKAEVFIRLWEKGDWMLSIAKWSAK